MLHDVVCFEPGAVMSSYVVVVSCRCLPIWPSKCVMRALYLATCVCACACKYVCVRLTFQMTRCATDLLLVLAVHLLHLNYAAMKVLYRVLRGVTCVVGDVNGASATRRHDRKHITPVGVSLESCHGYYEGRFVATHLR